MKKDNFERYKKFFTKRANENTNRAWRELTELRDLYLLLKVMCQNKECNNVVTARRSGRIWIQTRGAIHQLFIIKANALIYDKNFQGLTGAFMRERKADALKLCIERNESGEWLEGAITRAEKSDITLAKFSKKVIFMRNWKFAHIDLDNDPVLLSFNEIDELYSAIIERYKSAVLFYTSSSWSILEDDTTQSQQRLTSDFLLLLDAHPNKEYHPQ